MPRKKIPFVVAKCAQTLDGKIATSSGQSKWITSPKTRAHARRLRNQFDAIMVGINTVVKDKPSLDAAARTKKIKKIVLDSSLKISTKARIFQTSKPEDCFIAVTGKASKRKIRYFLNRGVRVIVCPPRMKRIRLTWLLKELAKYRIKTILIEGGAKVVGSALKENLVDRMHIYVAPKIVGDQQALSSIDGLNVKHVDRSIKLKNIKWKTINPDIFLQGDVYRNH